MNKQAPSLIQMATIAGFALSCFGLLLFLWVAFGGPTPFASRGYELRVPVAQVDQLADQSDVRISGVTVGKVTGIDLGEGDLARRAIVTVQLDPQYGPVPRGTRAIVRQKTLLGETYIELTPGDAKGANSALPDDSQLPVAQVAESVQLDQIFRAFDRKTREAFKQGALDTAVALKGRGATLNQAIGLFPPTLSEVNRVLKVANQQSDDVSKLIRNTGVVFNAISERQGQLSSLIRNSNTVFHTTAERQAELQDFFRIFPTFLRESRSTLTRLQGFSDEATPVMNDLVPVARQLTPTFQNSAKLAPKTLRFFKGLRPVIANSPKAFPSLQAFLDQDLPPLLARVPSYFDEFNPILQGASYYRRELAAFLGNTAAATNGFQPYFPGASSRPVKVLRTGVNLGPDSLTAFPNNRLKTNRANPFTKAGGFLDIVNGLKSFDTTQCSSGVNATIPPWTSLSAAQQAQFKVNTRYLDPGTTLPPFPQSETLYNNLIKYAMANQNQTDDVPAPACIQQSPFTPLGDSSRPATQYQHTFKQP